MDHADFQSFPNANTLDEHATAYFSCQTQLPCFSGCSHPSEQF